LASWNYWKWPFGFYILSAFRGVCMCISMFCHNPLQSLPPFWHEILQSKPTGQYWILFFGLPKLAQGHPIWWMGWSPFKKNAVFVLKNHLYNMDPPKPLFYHADVLEPCQDEANEAPLRMEADWKQLTDGINWLYELFELALTYFTMAFQVQLARGPGAYHHDYTHQQKWLTNNNHCWPYQPLLTINITWLPINAQKA